jgi:mRNA-degrading endonuclease RelE of RelBE toxin-antitoxin system
MAAKNNYQFQFSSRAEKSFAKLEPQVRDFILSKLSIIEKSDNPLAKAAKLVSHKNIYRYRFGEYRVIFAKDQSNQLIILIILAVGHRKDIYNF